MSSVLASPAQVPARVGYFRVSTYDTDAGVSQLFFYEPLNFAPATGYLSNLGNIVQFNSWTNAQSALTNGTTPAGTSLVAGQFLRDMGKSVHIEVYNAGTRGSVRVATLTKVQLYQSPGQNTEGVTGKSLTATPGAGNGYTTGYVVTWSANPDSAVGVPVAVVRTGY